MGWLELVVDPIRLHILHSLSRVPDATVADLADRALANNKTLRRHLDALVALGTVSEHPGESDGETPGRPASRFSLNPGIRDSVRSVLEPERSYGRSRLSRRA